MTVRSRRVARASTAWGLALALAHAGAPGPVAAADDPARGGQAADIDRDAPVSRAVFGTIMGAVFDAKKKPMVGCMVQLSSREEAATLRVTGTDEKGRYVFQDLPAGIYDIEVAETGGASRKKGRIEVRPPFRNIVDFEIEPRVDENRDAAAQFSESLRKAAGGGPGGAQGGPAPGEPLKAVPVRGTFLDAHKRPIPEVSVTLLSLEGQRTLQAFSGEDGTFMLPEVRPGRYRVLVASPGHVSLDLRSVEVSPMGGLNLALSLVDYPLSFKGRPEDRLPPEEPLPAPSAAPTSRPS